MMNIKYIAFIANNGEITKMKHAAAQANLEEGWNETHKRTIKHITFTIANLSSWMNTHYYDFDIADFAERDPRPNPHAVWNENYPRWEWEEEDIRNDIRIIRTNKLYDCDWTVLPDSPLSDADKLTAQTYRQELRDFPASVDLTNVNNADQVIWPTKPNFL